MNKRVSSALIFLAVSLILTSAVSLSPAFSGVAGTIQEIFFGYDEGKPVFSFFSIQNLTWWAFALGLSELWYRYSLIKNNGKALKGKYLSENENEIYLMKDVVAIRKNIAHTDNMLANLIKTLILRYQASQKSVEETHQMLNSQLELMQFKLDIDYNMVRYLSWIIPTLGFIGTVIGISLALNYAGTPGVAEQADFVSELTKRLSIAFYTTLVSLVMSAILVFIMHVVQAMEETAIQKSGEYCLKHLINKLSSPTADTAN